MSKYREWQNGRGRPKQTEAEQKIDAISVSYIWTEHNRKSLLEDSLGHVASSSSALNI